MRYAFLTRIDLCRLSTALAVTWCLACPTVVSGQTDDLSPPPQLATPSQRLMMEQVYELVQAGEIDESLSTLDKLREEADGRLVPIAKVQAASTLRVQRYIPLAEWAVSVTGRVLAEHPEAHARYQSRLKEVAAAALEELRNSKDLQATARAALRYNSTPSGADMQLLLCDLYLENGWGLAASQVAHAISTETRFQLPTASEQADPRRIGVVSLAWPVVWSQVADEEQAARLLSQWRQRVELLQQSDPMAGERLVQAIQRLVWAAAQAREALDFPATLQWTASLPMTKPDSQAALQQTVAEARNWPPRTRPNSVWDTFDFTGRSSLSLKLESTLWPAWTRSLERYSATSDRQAASKPRVGETDRGTLAYLPLAYKGKVFVNEMTRIVAYQVESGAPWPETRPALPLFDSQTSPAAYLPLGYPMVGVPRGSLAITDDCLYARMGNPITGRANLQRGSGAQSLSYLVGLDLTKQGSMLRGFPLHLSEPDFVAAEFDGPPLAWGELLLVAYSQRDNVGLSRGVAAFDRYSGELRWKTEHLASGTVVGSERANLISHQMLTLAGGSLFYNTNLGSIVCLDPLSGQVRWQAQYARPPAKRAYPTPDRFRYRDMTPCLVHEGLVYCAPQDAPEIFALDAVSGDLIWSTNDTQAADVVHLLGVYRKQLIVSGDRLLWFASGNGHLLGQFPSGSTPGMVHALPSPRGLGRGALLGDQVWWPVSGEILIFPAALKLEESSVETPSLIARLPLDSRGSEGGNLLPLPGGLLFAGPSRLLFYRQPFSAK